ncbi:unnamed protein product [Gongylonema pulchrum]|uniref:Kininogen-1 n=1 Tax=Gongylonema pulchrum TaxID=637853 RepID=A0A183DKB5_9BILA|nr:unnamed protein product [Gongylonema pulchrum]
MMRKVWGSSNGALRTLCILLLLAACVVRDAGGTPADLDNEFAEFEDMEEINEEDDLLTKPLTEQQLPVKTAPPRNKFGDEEEVEFSKITKKDEPERSERKAPQQLRFADVSVFPNSRKFLL